MSKLKYNAIYVLKTTIVIVLLWVAVSVFIQRFACTSMTDTEVFINIPRSFVGDWKQCN